VGREEYYAGLIPTLLVVLVVIQFVLIRNDANFIDLTLRLRRKVLLGFFVSYAFNRFSCCIDGLFQLGIVGLCFGLIVGRSILSVGYPFLVGRFLGLHFRPKLKVQ